jgi:hypothetical protein
MSVTDFKHGCMSGNTRASMPICDGSCEEMTAYLEARQQTRERRFLGLEEIMLGTA